MKKAKEEEKIKVKREPYQARLPGFITEEEVGLGDIIKRATFAFGIKPCGGCNRRAATLNSWFKFTRRGSR